MNPPASIYLDYNAGSPLRPEVCAALDRAQAAGLANPSSVHRSGQRARRALESARAQVANLVGADSTQIVFSSGGTESNNLAIFGALALRKSDATVVGSAVEHSSILSPLSELENRGHRVIRVLPDRDGRIGVSDVASVLSGDTALVTLHLANSETGTIQPLADLAQMVRSAGARFHIDAAQAVGRIPVDVGRLGCDLMTLSGHKLGAPSGIGALYVRERALVASTILGGPQEAGTRAGTPNLLGAIAMGAAAEAIRTRLLEESARIAELTRGLLRSLQESIPGIYLNGPRDGRLPNTLNLTFPGVLGESMLIALDLEGVEVSMGSACAAGAVEPSHVLRAMGRSVDEARSSLRLSLGWATTRAEIERVCEIIPRVWRRVAAVEPAEQPAGASAEAMR